MFCFRAADGFELHGHLFGEPTNAHAGLLIAGAMGVEQHFYADFARWMAAQGWLVLTFDYRGMGASRPAAFRHSLRGLKGDIRTWVEQDTAAAAAELERRLQGAAPDASPRPIHLLGHSLGGQVFGMLPNRDKIERAFMVGSGVGYWRHNAARLRRYVLAFWYGIVPLALRWSGYFPGRRLRMVGDVPHGVMAQWRRWCLHPEYMMGEGGEPLRAQYAAVNCPMHFLSFADDELLARSSTEALLALYPGAAVIHRHVSPDEVGAARIGHFGFFRSRFQDTLWPQVSTWLAQTPSGDKP